MTSTKQSAAAKKNIKKAQEKWQSMTPRQRSLAQPDGDDRQDPGTTGEGEYYRVIVRPKYQFTTFRNQDVGDPGGIQRLAGRRSSGSWADHAWLIQKSMAHVQGDTLVADTPEAQEILDTYGPATLVKGDIFKGRIRKNVAEKDKPTKAQQTARRKNIQKAQRSRSG